MSGNTSKRGWTAEEDQIILSMMSNDPQDRFKWIEVSKALEQKTGRLRTGKQCRERWQHQLNPVIVRDEWTEKEQQILFSIQREVGNKWAQIAAFLPGRTDNAVKNYFYSSVRRVLTRLNLYLARHKSRKQFKIIRQFEADYLSKLMAVVDGHFDKRVRLTSIEVVSIAKRILEDISGLVAKEYLINLEEPQQHLDQLILNMQDFRKNCKKRKQAAIIEDFGRYADSCSLESESSPRESSESNLSEKKQSYGKSRPSSSSDRCKEMMPMEVESNEVCGIALSTKNSTKSIEEENFNCQPRQLNLQRFESYCEPKLFKGISELREQPKEDDFMNLFRQEPFSRGRKMEEEEWEWQGAVEELDIFSLPFGQREDMLGESQYFGSSEVVTKFKMLEASIALDQCLLKARYSSRQEDMFQS